jgi:hypothetical protein
MVKPDHDDFINDISILFNKLKKTNSKKIFNELLNILRKRAKYAIDQYLWEMLYFYSIYFYKNNHYIGKIPIKYVTKHNQIVSFCMSKKIHNVDYTIVRFDTHGDMNYIKNSYKLPLLYEKYLDTNQNKYLEEAQEIVWDIGAAKSGVLITTGIKDLVWVMPEWVPDKQIEVEYFIKQNKKSSTLQSNEPDAEFDMEYVKDIPKKIEKRIYKKLRITNLEQSANNILNLIKINGNKFILDIDLDFFVCNGDKFNETYFKHPFDLQSYYRTKRIEINENIPRNKEESSKELKQYSKHLNNEIKKINKRINKFINLLKILKKKGVLPYIITLSDSSNVMFGECDSCNTLSNGYVPTNLALYVHTKVVENLHKLYN